MFSAYAKMWKNMCDFDGKSSRKDFWMAILGTLVIMIAIIISLFLNDFIMFSITGGPDLPSELDQLFMSLYFIISYSIYILVINIIHSIPSISLTVRRLNDAGFNAWYLLFYLVPVIGWLVVLILCCIKSKES